MKPIIALLLIVALLISGCSKPDETQDLYDNLLSDYNSLMKDNEQLKNDLVKSESIKDNLVELQNEHNKLILDYHGLDTAYAILEAYSESQRQQYNSLIEQFNNRYVSSGEYTTELYKENMKLTEKYKELDAQIAAVRAGKVSLLSDNLTVDEYTAFYKGWNLWWDSFNEDD